MPEEVAPQAAVTRCAGAGSSGGLFARGRPVEGWGGAAQEGPPEPALGRESMSVGNGDLGGDTAG